MLLSTQFGLSRAINSGLLLRVQDELLFTIVYFHCNVISHYLHVKMPGLCYTVAVQNLFWDSLSVFRASIERSADMKAVASLAAVTLFLRGPSKRSSRPCLKNIIPKGINQASQTILLPINVTNGASLQS